MAISFHRRRMQALRTQNMRRQYSTATIASGRKAPCQIAIQAAG